MHSRSREDKKRKKKKKARAPKQKKLAESRQVNEKDDQTNDKELRAEKAETNDLYIYTHADNASEKKIMKEYMHGQERKNTGKL